MAKVLENTVNGIKQVYKAGKWVGEATAQAFGVPTMVGRYSKTGDKVKKALKNFEKKHLPLSKYIKK